MFSLRKKRSYSSSKDPQTEEERVISHMRQCQGESVLTTSSLELFSLGFKCSEDKVWLAYPGAYT